MTYETADTAMTMLVLWLTFRVPVLAAQKKAGIVDAIVALALWIIWWLV